MKKIIFRSDQLMDEAIDIDRKTYLEHTGKNKPFVQKGSDNQDYAYAICPYCKNPVVLVGFFNEVINAPRGIYGMHARHDVPGLRKHDELAYQNCIYKRLHGRYVLEANRNSANENQKKVRDAAHNNWDAVIRSIIYNTGLVISKVSPLNDDILEYYDGMTGWMASFARLENIPMVAFYAEREIPLYKKVVRKESPLYELLQKYGQFNLKKFSDNEVQVDGKKDKKYLSETFKMVSIGFDTSDGYLREYGTIEILKPRKDGGDDPTGIEVKFEWDYHSFYKAMSSETRS